jgi:hypothetical protein
VPDSDNDDKSPIDRTLDVFVYLPVGFLLDFPRSIPRYIARGRKQLDHTRVLSQKNPLGRLQDQTRTALRGLGVDVPGRSNGSTPAPSTARPAVTPLPVATGSADDEKVADEPPPALDFDASALAITDYDSLSASQVVPRLDSLADDELETLRVYESATRGRKTILSKIALLQSP